MIRHTNEDHVLALRGLAGLFVLVACVALAGVIVLAHLI